MEPLVSVIIPVYKVEKYLDTCVDSVLKQTYKNLEIILVDDGSPDQCGLICDSWSKKDQRIKVLHKENGGLSSARNAGMKIAKADYWCFVDSDDWIAVDMIETMMNCFAENVDLVCCGKVIYGENLGTTLTSPKSMCLNSKDAIEKSLFDKDIGIAAWGKIYKRSLFTGVWFPEGEIHEDAAIMIQIFDRARKIHVINRALYYYRYNKNGISKSEYSTKFDVVLKHNLVNEQYLIRKYPELKKQAEAMVASGCFGMMLKILKTPKGYEQFWKQFRENKQCYLKRIKEYFTLCCNGIK